MMFPCLLPTQRKNAPPTALHHSFLFSRHVDLLMSMHSMFLYTHLHCFYSTAKRSQYNVGSCKLVPKVKAKGNGIHKSERLIVNETSRARQIALPGASRLRVFQREINRGCTSEPGRVAEERPMYTTLLNRPKL